MDSSVEVQEISTIAAETAAVVKLIREWRSQAPRQWPPTSCDVDPSQLQALLEACQAAGVDRRSAQCAVLGSEWLLRARPATHTDVEAQISRIRTALLRGDPDPNLAVFVELIAGLRLRRELRRQRFLVPFESWAVPSAELVMQLARAHHDPKMDRTAIKPEIAVAVRPGRIPKLAPIIAGILVEGIAKGTPASDARSGALGRAVAGLLLKRDVQSGEFRKWRGYLDRKRPSRSADSPQPETRITYREWLVSRFQRVFSSMAPRLRDWNYFRNEAESNPVFVFACVGDARTAQELFGVFWA